MIPQVGLIDSEAYMHGSFHKHKRNSLGIGQALDEDLLSEGVEEAKVAGVVVER